MKTTKTFSSLSILSLMFVLLALTSCATDPQNGKSEEVNSLTSDSSGMTTRESTESSSSYEHKTECKTEERIAQGEDATITKTCTWDNFRSISTGIADNKGRYSYAYEVFKLNNGEYVKIKNVQLFNQKAAELLKKINQQVKKDYQELVNSPDSEGCFDNVAEPTVTFDDLGVSFTETGVDFSISFGLPSACMAVDGTTVSFKFDEIKEYISQ